MAKDFLWGEEFRLDVARGKARGASVRNIFGYNTARTTSLGNMSIQRRFPFKYSEKTDIQLQMATNSGTHELSVFGEGIVIKEIMN